MKRLLPMGVLLALVSLSVAAGGCFMNDTGTTAYGLRVEFSEPVTVTGFGDLLTTIKPLGESTTFVFSGGAVPPWGDHWMIWEPGSAAVLRGEWLTEEPVALDKDSVPQDVEVTGQLLNAAYFAHPAYVMPGVSDREKLFAMPLLGIPELGLSPLRSGVAPAEVSWYGGVAPCSVLDSVTVDRAPGTIALTVIEGSSDLAAVCPEIAMLKATIVDLGELEPGNWTITSPNGDASPIQLTIS